MPRKASDTEVADFAHSIGMLVRRVRAAVTSHELSLTEASVLARLSKAGPATTAHLARLEGMKPQSMGTTIAALQERGLVQRSAHPTDGRQMNIELTEAGAALRKSVRDAKGNWLVEAISRLSEDERRVVFDAGAIIRRLVENDQQ